MLEITLLLLWFMLISGLANFCQKHLHYSYEQYPIFHICLILIGIAGVHFLTPVLVNPYIASQYGWLIGILAIAVFVFMEYIRGKHISADSYYGYETLGDTYAGLLSPQLSGINV